MTLHAFVCLWQLDQPSVLEMSEVGDAAPKMSFGLVQMEADLDFSLEIATRINGEVAQGSMHLIIIIN